MLFELNEEQYKHLAPEAKGQLRPVTLIGLSEAAQILGWDKRKLATYIKRGKFITPIQRLASGPIWTEKQVMEWMGH